MSNLLKSFKEIYDLVSSMSHELEKSELLNLLADARTQSLELQEENIDLKEKIKSYEKFNEDMEDYHLVQVSQCTVYQHKTNPEVMVCPRCVEDQKKRHFLQHSRSSGLPRECPNCKSLFNLHHQQSNSTPV